MTSGRPTGRQDARLAVLTFGCKVNQYESAFLLEQASATGWQVAAPQAADLVVINSCTVTAKADRQVRQALRQAARRPSPPRLVVTGCYAQRAPDELAGLPGVQAVLGNAAKAVWPQLAARLQEDQQTWRQVSDISVCRQFLPMPISRFAGHTRAFIKIQEGCNQQCSYCIVPTVRGPERSLPLRQVLAQLQVLVAQGCRELVLTGINLSRYGHDLPESTSLVTLCRTLRQMDWPVRLRLSSLEPQDLAPALLQELANWPQFCPHFHLPLQSGADEVLAAMQRSYQASWFEALVHQLAAQFPRAAIGLDVLVGFPTESDAAFRKTRDLLARLPIAYLHVFPFSPRPGTLAAQLPATVDGHQMERRARELRALAAAKRVSFYQRQVGQVVDVLVEGELRGRPGWLTGLTDNYLRVHCPGPREWANQVIRVRLAKITGPALQGRPLVSGY